MNSNAELTSSNEELLTFIEQLKGQSDVHRKLMEKNDRDIRQMRGVIGVLAGLILASIIYIVFV